MLTTFGPTSIETPKLATLNKHELGSTFVVSLKDDHRGNEDIEMTFGMIGSHNGNTSVSN
jgi:hypothetical protein